ncbi:MAG: ribosome biogenesis GTP-binding protein YihA/YsxC [Candidatus Eiseniibacteriota bacterium]
MARPLPATFVKGVVRLADLPRSRVPEIAVSGRSNVGKSSLLNVVFGRRGLAKVSSTPGKTREINFFSIGDRYHLVDLPGYGYARVPVHMSRSWGELVRKYLEERRQLAGVIQLIDARHDPTAQDREMLAWLAERDMAVLVVVTKTDKVKRSRAAAELARTQQKLAGFRVVTFSAATREGRGLILEWIDRSVAEWSARGAAEETR